MSTNLPITISVMVLKIVIHSWVCHDSEVFSFNNFKNAAMNDALMTLVTFLVSVVQFLRLIGSKNGCVNKHLSFLL